MATIINQSNTLGIAYDSGQNDTSTNYWTYAFGDSILFRGAAESPSSMWEKNPIVNCEFWRYSISSQSWIKLDDTDVGKNSSRTYAVRCNDTSLGSPAIRYDGDDSYLFAFKAQTTQGERGRCNDRVKVMNVGTCSTYNATVKGRYIYGRSLDYAYRYHLNSSLSLTLTDAWLTTVGLRGTKITSALIKRMISVKSAKSKT
jgi:hypothetical protein